MSSTMFPTRKKLKPLNTLIGLGAFALAGGFVWYQLFVEHRIRLIGTAVLCLLALGVGVGFLLKTFISVCAGCGEPYDVGEVLLPPGDEGRLSQILETRGVPGLADALRQAAVPPPGGDAYAVVMYEACRRCCNGRFAVARQQGESLPKAARWQAHHGPEAAQLVATALERHQLLFPDARPRTSTDG